MISIQTVFVVISTVLALVSGPSYVSDILKGRAKPQRATFLIFTLLSAIAFYGQLKLGARLPLIFTGMDVFGSLAVFLLSLKYGVSGFSRADKYAISVATVGVVISAIANQPTLAIVGVITADLAAMYLTLRKTYLKPETEPYRSWIMFGFAAVFSALSSKHYTFALLLYPLYIALATFAIPLCKYLGTRRQNSALQQ